MAKYNQIRVLFLDIGGVLLTNDWDQTIHRLKKSKATIAQEERAKHLGEMHVSSRSQNTTLKPCHMWEDLLK